MPKNQLFAPQSEVDAWMSSGIVKNRDSTLEKLTAPLRHIVRIAARMDGSARAEQYVNILSRSNIVTLGQLVCLGTRPTFALHGIDRVNTKSFMRMLDDFWPQQKMPQQKMPSLPSPDIAASIHPMLRSVPAFPWIVDCLDPTGEYRVGERYVPGVVPRREQHWTVELLLRMPSHLACHLFETRPGRQREVQAYYRQFAEQFEQSPFKPSEVTYFDEPAIAFGANGQIIVE